MADEILKKDANTATVAGGVTDDSNAFIRNFRIDDTTKGLKVMLVGGGVGTVSSVSVVTANGFAGTVATATTTPAITLSTTVTGLLKGNGTAISAASAGTDYQAPITLTTTGSSGVATFVGNTLNIPNYSGGSGTVTSVASADGSVTVTNPTTTVDLAIVKSPKLTTGRTLAITGDLAWTSPSFDGTGNVTAAGALATVNSNVGTFGSATAASQITVNAKGLITAASGVTITPAVGSVTGLGTGVATALAVNVGSAGAFVTFNGALGTPSSGTATNLSGTATGLTSGITQALASATTTVNVSSATAPSSGQVLTATSSTAATWQAASGGGKSQAVIATAFETSTRFTSSNAGTGGVSFNTNGAEISNGTNSATSRAGIQLTIGTNIGTRPSSFSTSLFCNVLGSSDYDVFAYTGSVSNANTGVSFNLGIGGYGFLFRKSGGTLTAYGVNDSSAASTTMTSFTFAGFTAGTTRLDLDAVSSATDVKFYVNGTLVATSTTNLPTGGGFQQLNPSFGCNPRNTNSGQTWDFMNSSVSYDMF